METRFDMVGNAIGAAFSKRFASTSMVIAQSSLPPSVPELAALALAEEGTRLADASTGVTDETWALVRKHYDDDQVAALVGLVALINAANRLGVILHQKGGAYEPGMLARMMSS